jgi:hypothetical protein
MMIVEGKLSGAPLGGLEFNVQKVQCSRSESGGKLDLES